MVILLAFPYWREKFQRHTMCEPLLLGKQSLLWCYSLIWCHLAFSWGTKRSLVVLLVAAQAKIVLFYGQELYVGQRGAEP